MCHVASKHILSAVRINFLLPLAVPLSIVFDVCHLDINAHILLLLIDFSSIAYAMSYAVIDTLNMFICKFRKLNYRPSAKDGKKQLKSKHNVLSRKLFFCGEYM